MEDCAYGDPVVEDGPLEDGPEDIVFWFVDEGVEEETTSLSLLLSSLDRKIAFTPWRNEGFAHSKRIYADLVEDIIRREGNGSRGSMIEG